MTMTPRAMRIRVFTAPALWAALVLAAFLAAPLAADNGSDRHHTERRQLEPLLLKIQRDYNIRTPRRGESSESVRNRFGGPESVLGPVGDPPITRWRYPGFDVVFEKDWVIHTVVDPDSNG